ncbi:MAG TPA: Ig-like domain-containing protein [Gemmatimonadales bacterium]|nr:Ig-like domain-containing protein [Gemmatimonadales bacterium]
MLFLGACPDHITDPSFVLTLSPQSASLFIDESRQFSATIKDDAGEPIDAQLTWTIDNPGVALVDPNGLVRGIGPGSTTLRVAARGESASATLTVAVDSGQRITVSPTGASLYVDGTQRFTATVTDRNGDTLAVTPQWESADATVASVDGSGLVRALRPGATTIRAKARGMVASGEITVAPRPSSAVLVGAGDIASCTSSGDEATAKLLDAIEGTVFTAGDLAYDNGSAEDYANCYAPSWGKHKDRTRPVPGNHEYFTFGASGYFDYFGSLAGERTKGYYSYELGGWHIIALNSNLRVDPGSPQEQWLREDLANSTAKCTLAYWHHPRFSSGADHGDDATMQPLWQALYEHGAEVVISGHDHIYERFAPQTPAGVLDLQNGIREFIVGTGGGSRDQLGMPSPNSEVRSNTTWGVLKLTLFPDRYEWKFVPVAGKSFTDSGTGSCR